MLCRLLFLVSALISVGTLTIQTAKSAVGTIDTENRFPFVVRLTVTWSDGSESICSGVAIGQVIGTAAHCVWDEKPGPRQGWARLVTIEYRDLDDRKRTATATAFRISRQYMDASNALLRSGAHLWPRVTLHDIAYLIADEIILTPYVHWGTELAGMYQEGDCADPKCADWSVTGKLKASFLEKVRQQMGDLDQVRVIVVGYGRFFCDDYDALKNCKIDDQRRFVEVPLRPRSPVNSDDLAAPWAWCTGQSSQRINPVLPGDSGGPVFVQALDGRWIFVGYTSRGDSSGSCASSMFNNLNLWRNVLTSEAYAKKNKALEPWKDSRVREVLTQRNRMNAKRLVDEWIESWSSPNKSALLGLERLYDGSDWEPDAPKLQFQNKPISFNQLYREKASFAEQWPERSYRRAPASKTVVDCDVEKREPWDNTGVPRVCAVSVRLVWDIKSPKRGVRSTGLIEMTLKVRSADWAANPLLHDEMLPKILAERQNIISQKEIRLDETP